MCIRNKKDWGKIVFVFILILSPKPPKTLYIEQKIQSRLKIYSSGLTRGVCGK